MRLNFELLPICVGIVGSRDFPRLDAVQAFVGRLKRPCTEVVSGGARGVDRAAVDAAKRLDLPWKEYLPDDALPSPAKFFARNTQIVEHVKRRGGIVVAFSTYPPISSGTKDSLNKCQKRGVPSIVFPWTAQGAWEQPLLSSLFELDARWKGVWG